MEIIKHEFDSREAWLQGRLNYIGGSEAAAVLGLSPHMSNVELWEIKTGRRQAADISEKPYVKYGTLAEQHLRALFALDHPEYEVSHNGFALYTNDRYPFAHASLDGELLEIETGRRGVLEIKTTEIISKSGWHKWDNQIPTHYFCQLLNYLAVTDYEFAILTAQIKYIRNGEMRKQIREYKIERADVQQDIDYLMEKMGEFWEHVANDVEPPRILPEI